MNKNQHYLVVQVDILFLERERERLHEADVVSWIYVGINYLIVCQINHTQEWTDVTSHTYCPVEHIIS